MGLKIKKRKPTFVQRFKQASMSGKFLLILKCLSIVPLAFFLMNTEGRKVNYKNTPYGRVGRDDKTKNIVSVQKIYFENNH
jgi:hypothetical protein